MRPGDNIYTETHSNDGIDSLERKLLAQASRTQNNSLDDAVRRKLGLQMTASKIDLDDRNDPPSVELPTEGIRPLDSYTAFPNGKDYMIPRVRIVPNTHPKAKDTDLAVHISQGSQGVSLSIETIRAILSWAEGK